jgi:hypothetical protein
LPETRFGRATYEKNIFIIILEKFVWHTTNGSFSSSVIAAVDGTVDKGVGERDVTTDDCSVVVVFGRRNVCGLIGVSCWCLED